MLVCFDKNGVLKEQLDSYGNPARVDSQKFKIFAYFKDINLENYGAAYIRLQRPDLGDSDYPILFMTQANLVYDSSKILPSQSQYFTNGSTYRCYLFDFSMIRDNMATPSNLTDDKIVTLLNMPGQWQAVITLISTANSNATNVVGTISFNVGGIIPGTEPDDNISYNVITFNTALVLAQKLNTDSVYYVREMGNFEANAAAGLLPKGFFINGTVVFDNIQKAFYKINSVTDTADDDYVSCSDYTKLVDFDDKLDIVNGIVVVSDISAVSNLTDYIVGQLFYSKSDGTYYRRTSTSPYYEKAENGAGILGSKNTLVRYNTPITTTIADLAGVTNNYQRDIVINFDFGIGKDYILDIRKNLFNKYIITLIDIFQQCLFVKTDISDDTTRIFDVISNENQIKFVIRKSDPNTLYGIDSDGNQVNIAISDLLDGYIKYYQVPDYQVNVSVIADILTNINGWVLTNFNYTSVTIAGYPAYKITTSGGDTLTEEQARTYMKAMTGSEYLPEYDFNRPQNSFMMLPDGTILKPQWDNSNGLLLYKMKRFTDTDYVNNNILVLTSSGVTLTNEQYAYVLTKNARVFYSATGIFYEKYKETSTEIIFKAVDANVSNNAGTLRISNASGLLINKTLKRADFVSASYFETYGKSKLDADFATKNYVEEAIQEVKQNSLQNVDTDEYPTLQDFLDSEGEEGYIYLYPIDLSDLTKGYYRYIWEYIPADDTYEWEYLGTTEIDLSDFEVSFEQETFGNGIVSVEFKNNTDYQLISLVDTVSVALVIPSEIFQGWIGSCTFTVGNSIPSFSLVNNSSYNVVFIVNNRKADVSGIALNLDTNGIVECLAECNGFDIRVYMKEVTN